MSAKRSKLSSVASASGLTRARWPALFLVLAVALSLPYPSVAAAADAGFEGSSRAEGLR
jgi:hypothetical protein